MCDMATVALVTAVTATIGSTATAIVSSTQQRSAAMQSQEMARASAIQARDADYNRLQAEAAQVNDQARLASLQRMKEGLRQRAALRTSAGESGLVGASFQRTQDVSLAAQGFDAATMEENRVNRHAALIADAQGADAAFRSRWNQSTAYYPSGLASALQIGSTALSGVANIAGAYSRYRADNPAASSSNSSASEGIIA